MIMKRNARFKELPHLLMRGLWLENKICGCNYSDSTVVKSHCLSRKPPLTVLVSYALFFSEMQFIGCGAGCNRLT